MHVPIRTERRPRSAVHRLALGLALIFSLAAAAAGMGVYALVFGRLDAERVAVIERELQALERIKGANDLFHEVLLRVRAQREGPRFLYLVVDQAGNCPVAGANAGDLCPIGNLIAWPDARQDADGWIRFELDGVPIIGRVAAVRLGYRLLVARETGDLDEIRRATFGGIGAAVALLILLGAGVGLLAARTMLRRVSEIDAFCRAVAAGELERRLPVGRHRDELDAVARSINLMLAHIAELMRVVRHLSEHAAHELRTPLARIRLPIERALGKATDPSQQRLLERALEQLDGAIVTLSSLLEIARAEGDGRDGFSEVDLAALAADVVDGYRPAAEVRDVRIEADLVSAPMQGSGSLLRAAVANLVDNAVKFAPPHSAITVSVRPCGAAAVLVVSDQGKGIPEPMRETVFYHFGVVDRAASQSGTGLGLTLVRAVARRHGLDVALADNRPGLIVSMHPAGTFSGIASTQSVQL
jgi:signal transduction histidine kinase